MRIYLSIYLPTAYCLCFLKRKHRKTKHAQRNNPYNAPPYYTTLMTFVHQRLTGEHTRAKRKSALIKLFSFSCSFGKALSFHPSCVFRVRWHKQGIHQSEGVWLSGTLNCSIGSSTRSSTESPRAWETPRFGLGIHGRGVGFGDYNRIWGEGLKC